MPAGTSRHSITLRDVEHAVLECSFSHQVRGLCGNFNDNALDDFQPPSGGVTEVDVKLFGDSWRLQKYCPESVDQIVTFLQSVTALELSWLRLYRRTRAR